MSYRYCNKNNYGGCNKFVKTTEVEYESDVLILTIPPMKLKNHDRICLCISQELPSEKFTPDTEVVFYVGDSTVKYTGITRLGNFIYADAIRENKFYPLYVATDTKAFVLQEIYKLGCTDHQFPIVPPVEVKEVAL